MKLNSIRKITLFALLLSCALMPLSCKKGTNPAVKAFSANGTILDKGNIAADGCGWQIAIGDSTYSPKNLSGEFEVNNLKVHVAFHKLQSRLYCSMVANQPGQGVAEIQIDTIKTQ